MHKDLKIGLTTPLVDYSKRLKPRLLLPVMSLLLLTACLGNRAPETEVVVSTEYAKQNVPLQERPKAVQFPPVDWYVVTEENLDEKMAELEAKTGNVVFFAITPKGYENLALGIAEMRRYIKDTQAIIGYYEEALTPTDVSPPSE
tara:strand:- start:417 stop:851 length:435 start_codon:yes stop_codon:yes gene_type:complete